MLRRLLLYFLLITSQTFPTFPILSVSQQSNFCAGTCPKSREYCQPLQYRRGGTCEPCWKCCAFSETDAVATSAACQNTCECSGTTYICDSARDCAKEGMFCDGNHMCQSCIDCTSQDCANQCAGFINTDVRDHVTRTHAYYIHMTNATIRAGLMAEVTVCPQLDQNAPPITRPNCPCAPFANATRLQCPTGHICTQRPSYTAPSDVVLAGSGALLNTVCIPCPQGTLCDHPGRLTFTPCPAGFYCPTPSSRIPCPPGNFCPEGSIQPSTCAYDQLITQTIDLVSPKRSVLERVLFDQDPFRGNYCPRQTQNLPNTPCQAGSYCPNASTQLLCPKGHYCRKQSTAPMPCPPLARCTKLGLAAPENSFTVLVFFACMILLFILSRVIQTFYSRKATKREALLTSAPRLQQLQANNNRTTYFEIAACGELIVPVKSITFTNISARSATDPNAHPWLWPNSGSLKPCELNAIMGSSGCGKSTLIEMVRGRVASGTLQGQISIVDGASNALSFDMQELTSPCRAVRQVRKLVGFVPQDDILLGELTVRENLEYSARLKLPFFPGKECTLQYITECVCGALGFDPRLQNRVVGTVEKRGISGGQRKRVNIGMELVGLHPIIFMDEPTSGLDASSSHSLLEFSKHLTRMGCTIVVVVHQPRCSSFLLFDQIILLSRYGTTFCGSPYEAITYYERALLSRMNMDDNPADAIMDLLTYGIKTNNSSRVLDQKGQATTWTTVGNDWMTSLRTKLPHLNSLLASSIEFDQAVVEAFIATLPTSITTNITIQNLIRIFEQGGVSGVSLAEARQFIKAHSITDAKSLVRTLRNICGSNVFNGMYDNIISKMLLLGSYIPPPPEHRDSTETVETVDDPMRQVRIMSRALDFGHRLMRKANIKSMKDVRAENSSVLEAESLLLILSLKARSKSSASQQERELIATRRITDAYNNCTSIDTLSTARQIALLVKRKILCITRSPWFIQLLIPSVAALIVGLIHGPDGSVSSFPSNIIMAIACVGVLSMVTHVRTFSLDKVFIRREVQNNTSLSAYFLAYNLVDLIWIALIPLTFFIPYYYLTFPLTPLIHFYIAGILVCWWSSSIAYVLSASPLELHWTNLIGVFIAVIFGAFIHGLNPSIAEARGTPMEALISLSYNRWTMESLVIREFAQRQETMPNTIFVIMQRVGICRMDRFDLKSISNLDTLLTLLKYLRGSRDSPDSQSQSSISNIVSYCSEYISVANVVMLMQGIAWRIVAFTMMWINYDTMMRRRIDSIRIPKTK